MTLARYYSPPSPTDKYSEMKPYPHTWLGDADLGFAEWEAEGVRKTI